MFQSFHNNAARTIRAAAWLGLAIAAGSGCGSTKQVSTVQLAPVSGKLTLDDKPLAEATMEFIPTGETPGQGGGATTNEDGTFTAMTPFGEEGLPPGDYQVVVSKLELPSNVHFDVPPDKTLPPADNPYREVLPPSYSDRMRSKLTVKVAPNGTDKMAFTLRSSKK